MASITVKAFAKINLALDVLGIRDDNFHEVEMVMQGINLYDELDLEVTSGSEIQLACPYPDTGPLTENLAYRAAKLLQVKYGFTQGIRITLRKNIPVAAGLAGGSADGAAVLLGLNALLALGLSLNTLRELASQLGSDVPFCLWPATAIARGRGELINEVHYSPTLWMVLCKPPYGVSTALVYQNLNNVSITRRPDIPSLLTALANKDLEQAYNKMTNVLEYSTFALHPDLHEQAQEIEKKGARRVIMAGSGPTLIAFTSGEAEALALAEKWQKPGWSIIVARTLEIRDLREREELYGREAFNPSKS